MGVVPVNLTAEEPHTIPPRLPCEDACESAGTTLTRHLLPAFELKHRTENQRSLAKRPAAK